MAGNRLVKFYTFGCQMNVVDSRRMMRLLEAAGYEETGTEKDADLVVLNTCSVREKAAQKVYSLLGRLRRYKSSRPGFQLVVAGCVAQQEREQMAERVPFLDVVMGPDQVDRIVFLLKEAAEANRPVVQAHFRQSREELFPDSDDHKDEGAGQVSRFVTVMKGCNQFCSYCIVPYTRGREVSKFPRQIVAEVERAVERGVKEVTLLGQNVNRYGMDTDGLPSFAQLLRQVHDVEGLERVRFVTSHPADCTDELVDLFGQLPGLCPYFHLPMQSGSDRVLKLMNRRYTRAHYMGRVERLRQTCPDLHLSTDLIVGFPGESETDFEETMSAAQTIRWGSAFSFKYSPRPGTAAADLADDVPEEVKKRRLSQLQQLLYDTMQEAMVRHVGRVEDVLVERPSAYAYDGVTGPQFSGRSGTNYIVHFPYAGSVDPVGKMVAVRIERALPHSLFGCQVTRTD